jgi:hypothetical protein
MGSFRMIRSLFLAALGALTLAACANPVTVDPGDDTPELSVQGAALKGTFTAEDGWLVSPALAFDSGANRVALMATLAAGGAAPDLRVRGLDGDTPGPWHDSVWSFDEEGLLAGYGALDEVFLEVQVAVRDGDEAALEGLTFSPALVDEGFDVEGAFDAAAPEDTQGLDARLAFVGVNPRSSWGARATRCSTRDGSFYRMALHHTAARSTSNPQAALRQIQSYHMDGRGYCDAAYHLAVGQDGRVWELRALPFRGGHTANNNTGNVGIVFLGCFDPACGNDIPTEALLNSGAGTVRMMNLIYGIPINDDRVRGHRQHSGAQTACPGAHLFPRLGDIKARARAMANQPSNPPPPAGPAPSGCGVLGSGQSLARGQSKVSCDGRFTFAHQGDGNVVLYQGGTPLWNTRTNGRSTGNLVMQGDGNLVLYTPGGSPIWASGTNGRNGATLAVQNDGNAVIYAPGPTAVWSTGTCCR